MRHISHRQHVVQCPAVFLHERTGCGSESPAYAGCDKTLEVLTNHAGANKAVAKLSLTPFQV